MGLCDSLLTDIRCARGDGKGDRFRDSCHSGYAHHRVKLANVRTPFVRGVGRASIDIVACIAVDDENGRDLALLSELGQPEPVIQSVFGG